jgi:hypothetical protein
MSKLKKIPEEKKSQSGKKTIDLETFIQKKKIQNDALQKIIKKLNSSVEGIIKK